MTKSEKLTRLHLYCKNHRCATCPSGVFVDDIYGEETNDCPVSAMIEMVESDE